MYIVYFLLEFREDVLMQILEFPDWLHLERGSASRVSARVSWTKLKSQPVRIVSHPRLSLDLERMPKKLIPC